MIGSKRHQCSPVEADSSLEKDLRMPSSSFLDSHNFVARLAEELQKYRKKSESRRSKCFFVGLIAASVGLIVLTAAAVALTVEHGRYQQVGPGDVLINKKDGRPLRVQQHYISIPLYDIQNIPLDQIEKVATITLQWGPDEYGGARQYYFTVESVFRDIDEGITEVMLSSNHRLIAAEGKATLEDNIGNTLGVFDFEKFKESQAAQSHEESQEEDSYAGNELLRDGFNDTIEDPSSATVTEFHENVDDLDEPDTRRQLGKKKKRDQLNVSPGPGGEAGYCMYGCGHMAVTYPYYYRPFFGYGYPLVGTEGMFNPGYGGNPVTELAANGVLGQNAGGVTTNLGGRTTAGGPVAAPPGYS